jgi:methylthioribose-1-phosphate isomerase
VIADTCWTSINKGGIIVDAKTQGDPAGPSNTLPRTIDWADGAIELIDQTLLPGTLKVQRLTSVEQLVAEIQRLAVRGAPALGVAGALGVALAAERGSSGQELARQAELIANARPTAINLSWGVRRAMTKASLGPAAILAEALAIRDEDIAACRSISIRGANLLSELHSQSANPQRSADGRMRIMTICNTGALAAVERGTALGVIREIFDRGLLELALPLETRPLLQGARLTAWELETLGIPYKLLVDSAGPFMLHRGAADAVIFGADRIAANGDTANKVGSFSLALAARYANLPVIVAAPETTIDLDCPSGQAIPIEDRGPAEVSGFGPTIWAPATARALNPAFDVTPHSNITAIVTDRRVIRLDQEEHPGNVPLEPALD